MTTLAYRRQRRVIIQVFQIIKGFDKISPDNYFEFNEMNRGNIYKIKKQRPNTKIRQNYFSQRVFDEWNALPKEAVQSKTINSFKNAIEKLWENDPIKFCYE